MCSFLKNVDFKAAGMKGDGIMINKAIGGFMVLALFFTLSCNENSSTPTSGKVKIGVDESYTLIFQAARDVFETQYKNASLVPWFKPEADLVNDFMNDSLQVIIVNRKLTENDEQYLRERQFNPRTTKIAIDALALIVNRDNPDSNFYYSDIRDILTGKITRWKEINPKSKLGNIELVFDNLKSGNPRYFQEKFNTKLSMATCKGLNNNEELISYIEKNPQAIGVLSVNWISDPQDSVSHGFLSRFRVAGISAEGEHSEGCEFYRPHPYYIAKGFYPYTREVYCINRETFSGLASGFSNFIAGEKGQRIIYRMGMVPAAVPPRIIEIRN